MVTIRKRVLWFGVLPLLVVGHSLAQDILGDWQGTLRDGRQEFRTVIEIKETDQGLRAIVHSIDQTTEVLAADSVAIEGPRVKLSIDAIGASYEGKLSSDSQSIAGVWIGGAPDFLSSNGQPTPLELRRCSSRAPCRADPTAHTTRFVSVQPDIKLEVLDWGGSGRTLVLIAGAGNTAHTFDKFATKLSSSYHVYGITRRGYGASSAPAPTMANYTADRLGDDVLAVMDALKLQKPILIGHSLGGEELSSIGSRYPDKVAGLIYLDAAYAWAYYDQSAGDLRIDRNEAIRKLEQLQYGRQPELPGALINELLQSILPALERDLRREQKRLEGIPAASIQPLPTLMNIGYALQFGMQKYTDIRTPILAIYALPHERGITDPAARTEADAKDMEISGIQAKAFEMGLPSARVVRLPHANHFIYLSNEEDVLREMKAFISSLP